MPTGLGAGPRGKPGISLHELIPKRVLEGAGLVF